MMGERHITPQELRTALVDLMMATQCEIFTGSKGPRRQRLEAAVASARKALEANLTTTTCIHCLRRAADEADAEAQQQPGHRRDLEG